MKRLTVRFEDEALYTELQAEAARRNQPLADVVAAALREWLDAQEDADLLPLIDSAQAEWENEGGIEAAEFFRRLREESDEVRAL